MNIQLVVIKPFRNYIKGDVIMNIDEISQILNSDHKSFVVKIEVSAQVGG
jgi:hypothetical protein